MSMRIFGNQPMVTPNGQSINVVFQNGEKMVSVSLDDSCGRMSLLARGSIECHRGSGPGDKNLEDATDEVFVTRSENNVVWSSIENFNR